MLTLVVGSSTVPPSEPSGHRRAELAADLGVAASTIYRWQADPKLGFPPPGPDQTWANLEPVRQWYASYVASKKSRLTEMDRSGDADDLLDAREAALVLGYRGKDPAAVIRSYRGPRHEGYFPDPDDTVDGRSAWRRSTIWRFGDARERHGYGRAGRSGRPKRPDPHLPAVRAMLQRAPNVTAREVAEALEVHESKAYRLLREVRRGKAPDS
jgi:transposase